MINNLFLAFLCLSFSTASLAIIEDSPLHKDATLLRRIISQGERISVIKAMTRKLFSDHHHARRSDLKNVLRKCYADAAKNGHKNTMVYFIKRFESFTHNRLTDNDLRALLRFAAFSDSDAILKYIVIFAHKRGLTFTPEDYQRAFQLSVQRGRYQHTDFFVENGVDINLDIVDRKGHTMHPLAHILWQQTQDKTKKETLESILYFCTLLDAGARLNQEPAYSQGLAFLNRHLDNDDLLKDIDLSKEKNREDFLQLPKFLYDSRLIYITGTYFARAFLSAFSG